MQLNVMSHLYQNLWSVLLPAAILLWGSCSTPSEPISLPPNQILGGLEETGYDQIGVLQHKGTKSPFCTAVLVAPRWVLTAAHCLENKTATMFQFVMGSDISQAENETYLIDAIEVHPLYRTTWYVHDLALAQLRSPVDTVPPIEMNKTPLTDEIIGTSMLHVGYGRDDAGAIGIKRSAFVEVYDKSPLSFSSHYTESVQTGICTGDSGGAVVNDQAKLVGIISNFSNFDDTNNCVGSYGIVDVERYQQWLATAIGTTSPSCIASDYSCHCDAACGDDGNCAQDRCEQDSCAQVYECFVNCNAHETSCLNDCYATAEADALEKLSNFLACAQFYCSDAGSLNFAACLTSNCADDTQNCLAPDYCRITGGDCGAGSTCRFGNGNLTYCVPTLNSPPGASCTTDAPRDDCKDGSTCLSLTNGTTQCRQLCYDSSNCPVEESCMASTVFNSYTESLSFCMGDIGPPQNGSSSGCSFNQSRTEFSILSVLL